MPGELGELGDQGKFDWGAWGFVQSEIECKPSMAAEFLKVYYLTFPIAQFEDLLEEDLLGAVMKEYF